MTEDKVRSLRNSHVARPAAACDSPLLAPTAASRTPPAYQICLLGIERVGTADAPPNLAQSSKPREALRRIERSELFTDWARFFWAKPLVFASTVASVVVVTRP